MTVDVYERFDAPKVRVCPNGGSSDLMDPTHERDQPRMTEFDSSEGGQVVLIHLSALGVGEYRLPHVDDSDSDDELDVIVNNNGCVYIRSGNLEIHIGNQLRAVKLPQDEQ